MKVAVVGAGVVGVLTAHYLRASGHQVIVFDGEPGPAELTSKANGAQLSYSYTDAMGSPSLLSKLPGILLGRDPAFKVSPSLSPSMAKWGLQFLQNCSASRSESNTLELQKLALQSAQLMEDFCERFGEHISYRKAGKLVLLSSAPDENTKAITQKKRALGCDVRLIQPDEVFAMEPSLRQWNTNIAGAIYSPIDASGDAYLFSKILCKELEDKGVEFNWSTRVTSLVSQNGKLAGVQCQDDFHQCDAAVICTAEDHQGILKKVGVRLPILPVAGYSITLPSKSTCPSASVTALDAKTVFCRLGDQVRIAGFADINISPEKKDERVATLINSAKNIAPEIADYSAENIHSWVGYRPVTPNSIPICSETKVSGLFLNIGHGALGWTLAAATAKQISDGLTKVT